MATLAKKVDGEYWTLTIPDDEIIAVTPSDVADRTIQVKYKWRNGEIKTVKCESVTFD